MSTNSALAASSVDALNAAEQRPTAVVYCEANFGGLDGKTANGLVRHSAAYEIVSVIDSQQSGLDAGFVLDGRANGIPICGSLSDARKRGPTAPDTFIFGVAPASGLLSQTERALILEAMGLGMNIVNGLHEFLNDDPEFVAAGMAANVTIRDVRKPRPKKSLRLFSGKINTVTCPRIAVLGTDGAIGKRTTATILTSALNASGLKAVLVGTGQTGLIQGAKYGIALDAIPAQFCSGEMEAAVVEAFEAEAPDVILIEGQGALSHPAYLTSTFILRGSRPDGVVLQHAPGRRMLGDFPQIEMPAAKTEIQMIQTFCNTRVIGLTLNHENLSDAEVDAAAIRYESELGIPVAAPLKHPTERLLRMVLSAYPELQRKVEARWS